MVVLQVYEAQGIRDGAPQNQMKGPAFKTELATAYPECRLVVTKETLTVEGMIKIVLRSAEGQAQHRQDHLYQRRQRRLG